MKLPAEELAALLVTTSFAAGLNLYATTATLGLLSRFGVLDLPPTLHLLNTWPVIVVSLALFAVEFFADKVPAFDLIWNALHTFIRVPIAALLAYRATAQLSPTEQIVAAALGGVIALAAHGLVLFAHSLLPVMFAHTVYDAVAGWLIPRLYERDVERRLKG